MDKPQVIGIGLNGLVGSRLTQVLENEINFIPMGKSTGVDITNPKTLKVIKNYPNAEYVFLLAAKTDVDDCEKDRKEIEKGEAWKINVTGTANVAEVCRDLGKKIIYISTDFIFDGELEKGMEYIETDQPNPVNWYGETKFQGEKVIEESDADYLIVRLAYPYRTEYAQKTDFLRTLKNRLEKGIETKVVEDHIFSPTFIDDFARAIGSLIKNDSSGIFHTVGADKLSPFEAAQIIAREFNLDKELITKTTRKEFFQDRAPRPFNLALSNAKIEEIGVKMRGFEECLHEIKSDIQ